MAALPLFSKSGILVPFSLCSTQKIAVYWILRACNVCGNYFVYYVQVVTHSGDPDDEFYLSD